MNMKKLLVFLFFVSVCSCLYGQSVDIRGQIVDEIEKQPLPGVIVTIKGTKKSTTTGVDGKFNLTTDANALINISLIGYQGLELRAEDLAKKSTIEMSRKTENLEEVIVVGYGVQTKASSVGSIATTSGKDLLKNGNVNTVSEALQGQLNGVIAINNNGKPGESAANIFIRGKASFNNSSPLVLVDGIDRNMNDVDINEIESVSVLKDASATAVYGVRGANGVILVTTKRGSNEAAKVNFSSGIGLKQPTKRVNYADYLTSMKIWNEAAGNDKQWDKIIPQSTISAWESAYATGNYGPYNDVFPEIDWYDVMMKDVAFSQNYNLNVRGGTQNMSYFASVGYQNDGDNYNIQKQAEFDPRNYFKRYNLRSNFDFNLTKSTLLSVNVAGKISYKNGTSGDNIFTPILQAPTNVFPLKYSDGYWGDGEAMGFNILSNVTERGQTVSKSYQGWYDVILKQDLEVLTKGLSAQGKISYNQYSTLNSNLLAGRIFGANDFEGQSSVIRYYRQYDYANPTTNADGTLSYPLIRQVRHPNDQAPENLPFQVNYDVLNNVGRRLYYEFGLNYNRLFGNHKVTALALVNRQVIEDKVDGANQLTFPSYTEDWVGRVTYNWKQRYLAEVNMSYTGSEKFAPGKRFGFFPSFSAGWRISDEPFVKKLAGRYLSNLKLRYSYGKVGSDFGAPRFNYIQLYNSSGNAVFGESQNVNFGPLYTEGSTANINSTWEVAIKQNLGIELGFWNKLTLNVDLFDEKRSGILMTTRTTPSWFGAGLPSLNIGETKNHGVELELGWKDGSPKGIQYFGNFNFSTSENRVVNRDDPGDFAAHLKDAGKPIGWQSRLLAVGNYGSIDDVFNHAQTAIGGASRGGVIPGDLVYIDFNGDGIINGDDQVAVSQLDYPLTTFALNLGISFKGFSFSTLLYAPVGAYKNQFDQFLVDFPSLNVKVQPNSLDRWTPETANSTGVIRPSTHFVKNHNNAESTYKYADYSYVRLKNVTISYDFPKKMLKQASISSAQLFASGNNLLTSSNVDPRVDPETGGSGSYPIVRTYTFGLRLSF